LEVRLIGWVRTHKPYLLVLMGVIFAVFVGGIQAGIVGPNDPAAAPLAVAFVVLMLLVLLT
jgi:hypothetical protein